MIALPPVRDYAYYTIGEHKGNSRIWIQGGQLTKSNIFKGLDFEVVESPDDHSLIIKMLTLENPDSRVVSGRKKKSGQITPIIELNNAAITKFAGTATKVRADFCDGHIRISIYHMDMTIYHREQSLLNNIRNGYITKGVLCCGIGVSAAASDEAFKEHGIEPRTEFVIDKERSYLDIFDRNNPASQASTVTVEGMLEDIEPSLLKAINILLFSLPCTGHSKAGKAKNQITHAEEHPVDATAILGLIRVIDQLKPAILVSENVLEAKDSATYILLKGMLGACGYNVTERTLSSEQTGSVENRKRWWFVATSKGLPVVDLSVFPKYKSKFLTFSDVQEEVPADSKMWKPVEPKRELAAKNLAKGNMFGFNIIEQGATNIGICGKWYQKGRNSEPHILNSDNQVRLLTTSELGNSQNVHWSLLPTQATT